MTVASARSHTGWWAASFASTGVVLVAGALLLAWGSPGPRPRPPMLHTVVELAAFLAFVLLGALLVLRRPHHPIGWLLAALGLSVLLQQGAQAYALRSVASSTELPGWRTASWVSEWMIDVPLVLFVELLLLFPTGRPAARADRVLAHLVGIGGVALTAIRAIVTWPQRGATLVVGEAAVPDVLAVGGTALIVCLPAAVALAIVRFRRAAFVERQQLKWLLVAAVGLLAAAATSLVAAALDVRSSLIDAAGIVSIAGIAAAMALAILHYGLYDIDRILSRTVSYGVLTVLLAAVYTLGVVAIGRMLDPIAPDSNLAVAGSTLLVAAAFNPLRVGIRRAVARRFNRSRYQAELVAAEFRSRLRGEVRLDELRHDLVTTVVSTVQPATVSVWMRPTPAGGRGTDSITTSTVTRERAPAKER